MYCPPIHFFPPVARWIIALKRSLKRLQFRHTWGSRNNSTFAAAHNITPLNYVSFLSRDAHGWCCMCRVIGWHHWTFLTIACTNLLWSVPTVTYNLHVVDPFLLLFVRDRSIMHTACVCEYSISTSDNRAWAWRVHSRTPPTTSWWVTCAVGEIKFGEIFVPIQSMNIEQNFYPAKFLCCTVPLLNEA